MTCGRWDIRIKSLGGILFNLAIALCCWYYPHNLLSQALITANLMLAITSLSDLEAFVTGMADCFYCGNFGLIAERKLEDSDRLLPTRMVEISQQMGQETEVRGEQAGGGLVIGQNGKRTLFVAQKVVNRKGDNLTKFLEAAFASTHNKAIASGVKPLKSTIMGVWHYRSFSTVQVINVFDYLSSQGIIGELFIFTGEISSFINCTQGKAGLTTVSNSSFLDNNNSHRYRIFVNGSGRRTAEPSTVTVAAAAQTLTELLLYIARQMRHDFPRSHPLGMTLNPESVKVLTMMKEDFLNKNLLQIIGTNSQGKSHNSNIKKDLLNSSSYWANHVTETPLAWAIHALYILISVGWAIPFGYTLSLVKTLSNLIFKLANLPTTVTNFLNPVISAFRG
ncbi:MAG: hypothetical protein AAF383_00825 [Cyanobacteria bacterium P01_A01_bin.83]